MRVALKNIEIDRVLLICTTLHIDQVEIYCRMLDNLPPIDVFEVRGSNKLLMADGWHRYRAAQNANQTEIEANVHKETREQAAIFVATANANKEHGLKRTQAERRKAVVRLKELTNWPNRRIGEKIGCNNRTVGNDLKIHEVTQKVPGLSSLIEEGLVEESVVLEICEAPQLFWAAMVRTASLHGWRVTDAHDVRNFLNDWDRSNDEKRAYMERLLQPGEEARQRKVIPALQAIGKLLDQNPRTVAKLLTPRDRDTLRQFRAWLDALGADPSTDIRTRRARPRD